MPTLNYLGRDLIGVQNLIKKHQAMLAEINNHENRVRSVCQSGEEMVQEGIYIILFVLYICIICSLTSY